MLQNSLIRRRKKEERRKKEKKALIYTLDINKKKHGGTEMEESKEER